MEVCRKQGVVKFLKALSPKSIISVHAKKLLNISAFILSLLKTGDGEKITSP